MPTVADPLPGALPEEFERAITALVNCAIGSNKWDVVIEQWYQQAFTLHRTALAQARQEQREADVGLLRERTRIGLFIGSPADWLADQPLEGA